MGHIRSGHSVSASSQTWAAGLNRFRVLDECDEMLNMGFVEDVEKILGAGGEIQVPVSAAYLA